MVVLILWILDLCGAVSVPGWVYALLILVTFVWAVLRGLAENR